MKKYLTSPKKSTYMPKGIPYIIGNELAERFSFYGMKAILIVFMTQYLMDSNGNPDLMNKTDATFWYHIFTTAVYFTPILGAIISDAFLGKYKTILLLSTIYCLGHFTLAIDETRLGLLIGLSLISVGAGGIKPCVSAHVGDQFGKTNSHLLEKVFSWFYLSINIGAAISSLLTPILLNKYGPYVAFGIPGILMLIATVLFWMGRNVFVHIPPIGKTKFLKELAQKETQLGIVKLIPIYIFVTVFWALFDQTGSTWVLQAKDLDRNWLGFQWLESQIQAVNPMMILILVPFCTYYLYPYLKRYIKLTAIKKISIGLFLAVPSFIIIGLLQSQIEAGLKPSIGWQVLAYAILTLSEVFISITCLEFSYTQAPNSMKSIVMGIFMISIALGNFLTAIISKIVPKSLETGTTSYFYFYAALMFITATLFLFVVKSYREKTYLHSEN